jgi:RNA polymerase sigma factor (sigma-70 family)
MAAQPAIRNQLIEDNRGLVHKLAHNYTHVAELEELIAWGNLALVEAADRYDPTRGAKFSSFAWKRIRGAMIRGTRQQHRSVRISEGMEDRIRKIEAVRAELTQRFSEEPIDEEIAEVVGLPPHKVTAATIASNRYTVQPEDAVLPFWVTESPEQTERALERAEEREKAQAVLGRLDQRDVRGGRERGITRRIFVSHRRDGRTYEEIAEELTLSVQDVKNALERVRTTLPNDPALQRRMRPTPPNVVQLPRGHRSPRRVRRRAPVEVYILSEEERARLGTRCDAKYRRKAALPSMAFDLEAWRGGAEGRRRERIARAWEDVEELKRLSKIRRFLCFPRPLYRDPIEAVHGYVVSKKVYETTGEFYAPEIYTQRIKRGTVEEAKEYARHLEFGTPRPKRARATRAKRRTPAPHPYIATPPEAPPKVRRTVREEGVDGAKGHRRKEYRQGRPTFAAFIVHEVRTQMHARKIEAFHTCRQQVVKRNAPHRWVFPEEAERKEWFRKKLRDDAEYARNIHEKHAAQNRRHVQKYKRPPKAQTRIRTENPRKICQDPRYRGEQRVTIEVEGGAARGWARVVPPF